MTKQEAKIMREEIRQTIDGKSASSHIGTWMDRPGLSLYIALTSRENGRRIVVHKWDDEEVCSVRYITGDFWRDPDHAKEFGAAQNVEFSVPAITDTAKALIV